MEKLFCKKGITISLRCLLIVASFVFGSSAWGQTETTKTIFSETFDKCKGTGGNDGKWSDKIATDPFASDNTGWTNVNASGASKCAKYGTSKKLGKATTPQLNFIGDATLTFRAGAWSGDKTTLKLSISNGKLSATTVTMKSGAFSEYTINITDVTANPTITFEGEAAKSSRFFLDDVVVTQTTTSGGGGETELTDRELSFGETKSFDAEVGGTFSAPTLTGVTTGVTYASSNEAVASVDAAGEVTINGMGHATITASAKANETYKSGSAFYDIYVYGKGTIEKLKTYIKSTTATDIYFNLTSTAVVTGTNESNAFMEDGSAGIYLYKNGHGLTAGNSFTGKVKAKGMLFKDSYELTEFIPANTVGTADIPVTGRTIQYLTDSENAGYKKAESMRVKLTGVTVTSDLKNKMCTIKQNGYSTTLYLNQNAWTVTNGSTYNITGYPTIYNGTWEFKVIDKADLEATGESKTAATVTFNQESYTVETKGNITVSATTNSTAAIVYSISPADGNVSINANTGEIVAGTTTGTYTITATVPENESYTSASADCELTVKAPSFNIAAPTYYKKITSTDELVLGTQYIIANIEQGKGLPASGTITTVATISEENKENITDNTLVKSEYVADFAVLTLQKDENDNYVLINEEGQYLTGANGTDLYWKDRKLNFSTWNISFDKSGNALIETTVAPDPKRNIMINSNSIKYYASSNDYTKVQLYQKVTDLAISTLTNGYATFVTDVPYVMPKGACGYAVTVAPQAGVITKTEAYTEGQKVPAQTALLIGGASGTNYYPAVLKENVAASYTGENYMEGRRTAEGYTNTQKGVAVYYYKLALNSASKPGFYYGAADGAAFQLTKPTTAYLAVPQSITPVNGYLIDFDGEETGISTIAPTNGNADSAIYNLNGIRMTQTLRSLPKGVYIVNGKKVIK